jgi:putative PEP-CTERM system TPR-repeat lipoprotein
MNLRPTALAVALAFSAPFTFSACDSAARLSPEAHIQRAQDYTSKGDLASAVIELKNAIAKNPQAPHARILLGEAYIEMGDAVSAEKELVRAHDLGAQMTDLAAPLANALVLQGKHKEVLEKSIDVKGLDSRNMAELHIAKGRAYLGLGQPEQAEETFGALLAVMPDSPVAWWGQALLAYDKRQWDEADKWNEKILAANPAEVRSLGLKGDIGLARGDAKTAEAAYSSAVKLRPENPLYRVGLAIAQIGNGKFAEAKKHLDSVLKSFPADSTANYYRAVAAYQLKEYDAAKTHAENALNNSAQEDLRIRLLAAAASYGLGQLEAANKHMGLFLAKAPSYDPARMLQAAIQLRMGQVGEAAKSVKGITTISENDAKLLNALGMAAIQQSRPDIGVELFQRTALAHPDDALARGRLGIARSASGEYQSGIEDLEQALRLNPNLDAAQAMLAFNYLRAGEADKALQAARRLQERQPQHPDGFTLAGLAHVLKKEYPAAKAAFSKALTLRPGDPNASGNLAALALQEGNGEQARRLLGDVLKKYPEHVPTILKLAELDLKAGRPSAAEKRLKDALDKHPDMLGLRLALARFYLSQRKPEMALALTEKVKGDQSNDPGVLELKGIAQLQTGQTSPAVSTLEKATKAAPNSPNSHYQLALAYEQLNNLARASEELRIAQKLAPDFAPAKFTQARLLAKGGKLDAAQTLLKQLATGYPNEPSVMELRGDLALVQNRPKEAVVLYKTALAQLESNSLIVRLATAQFRAGDQSEGIGTLSTWLKRYPNDQYTRGILADALLARGQPREAREQYAKLADKDPNNVAVLNNLAWASMQMGAVDEALSYAQRAHKMAPEQPQVLDTLAMVLLRKGNHKEALDKLNKAAERAPGDAGIRLHYAQALIAAGQSEKAQQVLKDLLARKTPFAQRKEAENLLAKLK